MMQALDLTCSGLKNSERESCLRNLSDFLVGEQNKLPFEMSSRGWCYYLEPLGLRKGSFDTAQDTINECRKKGRINGFLDIDFVLEDNGRRFQGVEKPEVIDPVSYYVESLKQVVDSEDWYTPDWWEGEKYYIQMMVEKVDLISLFKPICEEYHIPIANAKGWSDLYMKGDAAKRFRAAEENGLTPVLLYCGDFDPYGLKISEKIPKLFREIEGATQWDPSNLIVDRFGLNYDFITAHDLTWIDNLESGSGKDMLRSTNSAVKSIVADFLRESHGRAGKVEANAIVKDYEAGRSLARSSIEKYLGTGSRERFTEKKSAAVVKVQEFKKKYGLSKIFGKIFNDIDGGDL